MSENKRFMVDDAGTLIDMRTREMYDIVEEVCPVLNALHEENEQLKQLLLQSYTEDGINAELTDKEKASEEFTKCTTEIRKLQESVYALNCAFENANDMLKRCLNEEENEGNIHKDCEYYNSEKDFCNDYMMGKVSRYYKCIEDLVDE